MIQVHINCKGTEQYYATRLSALDVLARLAAALRNEASYIQLRPYLEAYIITQNKTCPVVKISAHELKLSDQDSVEVLFYPGSEYFTLREISDRFPHLDTGVRL